MVSFPSIWLCSFITVYTYLNLFLSCILDLFFQVSHFLFLSLLRIYKWKSISTLFPSSNKTLRTGRFWTGNELWIVLCNLMFLWCYNDLLWCGAHGGRQRESLTPRYACPNSLTKLKWKVGKKPFTLRFNRHLIWHTISKHSEKGMFKKRKKNRTRHSTHISSLRNPSEFQI